MKFLAIESRAIDEIVEDRFLQSTEFEQGEQLIRLLGDDPIGDLGINPRLELTDEAGGRILTHAGQIDTNSKWLVIDIEHCDLLKELSPVDGLTVFQKLCRFCKKLWAGMSLTFSEQLIKGSSKAVLFPFDYRPTPYRVVMEREPWDERLSKRGQAGNFLLAYKAGYVSGSASREAAVLTNFRKAFEAIAEVRTRTRATRHEEVQPPLEIKQLQVAKLADDLAGNGSLYRGFDDWMTLLTTQQQRFVRAEIAGPHRIEGAAGTGKTLCLMLKSVYAAKQAKASSQAFHTVFVTHSEATKRAISEVMSVIDEDGFTNNDRNHSLQSIRIQTLSDICRDLLRQAISETEFIDRDAMESKELQLLYIEESVSRAMREDFPSHERFLSDGFSGYLRSQDRSTLVDMLQHEISVIIKGRASEDFDTYKRVPPLKYGLPTETEADKGFVFTIFRHYQQQLRTAGQFDTDDVVLTAIGQLDTPIWRRRRTRDGYDAVFIDETHLFNINELHIFHHFTKQDMQFPIVYSIDRSQAVGDRGWTTTDLSVALTDSETTDVTSANSVNTVFRSSPDVVRLAFSIVASGATLFTNFDNPMDQAVSGFTASEERLTAPPVFYELPNEDAMVEAAFERAETLHDEMGCKRSDVLIVSLDERIVARLESYAQDKKKPHHVLKRRGDTEAIKTARDSAQFVIGHADYVGGLEFFAVVIVGVDQGRVPPLRDDAHPSSKSYQSYASHNRLYVAVSRAKYRVEMLGEKVRGPSTLVEPAIKGKLLEVHDLPA